MDCAAINADRVFTDPTPIENPRCIRGLKMKRIAIALVGLAALARGAQAAPFVVLTLSPADGFLSGGPGSAVGWGYDVSTDSDFVVIDSLSFDDLTPVGTQNLLPPPPTGATAGSYRRLIHIGRSVSGLRRLHGFH